MHKIAQWTKQLQTVRYVYVMFIKSYEKLVNFRLNFLKIIDDTQPPHHYINRKKKDCVCTKFECINVEKTLLLFDSIVFSPQLLKIAFC